MEKNIELAIQKEAEYLDRKVNHCDNTANIYEYLAQAGYDNIDDFQKDKNIYLLKSEEYQIVEEPEINADVPIPYLENNIPAFLYTINCEENYAFLPLSWNDYTLIEQYGFTPVKLGYDNSNGPILSANGDLRIYLIYNENINISYNYFAEKLVEYLETFFEDVVLDNNDIMIGNYKVIGGADTTYNGMKIVVFQINFVDKTEAIQNICPVRSKQPGHIDSSIVTAEEIKNEFLSWLMK